MVGRSIESKIGHVAFAIVRHPCTCLPGWFGKERARTAARGEELSTGIVGIQSIIPRHLWNVGKSGGNSISAAGGATPVRSGIRVSICGHGLSVSIKLGPAHAGHLWNSGGHVQRAALGRRGDLKITIRSA